MGTIQYHYSNVALPASVGNSGGLGQADTSLFCQSPPSGYPAQFPFKLELDPDSGLAEVVKVNSGSGTAADPWILTRQWDGTLAVPHAEGAVIKHRLSQEDLALARDHEAADNVTPDASQPGSPLPHGLPLAAWLSSSFSVISEQALTSAVSQISFSAIPQTSKHLLLVLNGRLSGTTSQPGYAQVTLNGDGSARYGHLGFGADHLGGSLSGVTAHDSNSASGWSTLIDVPSSQTGSAVNGGGGFVFFPDYASNTFTKTCYSFTAFGFGTSVPATGQIRFGFYNPPTQAGISSIALAASQGNFVAGTTATLYGIG